jgi:hypothetical protein
LSENFTSYASTQWLKNPENQINGMSPSECMNKNKHIIKLYNMLNKEISNKKIKKCK